ncbi:MAG TPA: hypothetical protein VMT08_09340 [Bradyrhizobium sp.]|nr:hypothetical protein [Bradyrhizobium sp.]
MLISRRISLGDLACKFDITWFVQAMHKYRYLQSEVMVASLFLQLFALVSPLFFQMVNDKELVHRGLTTLDVLVFGLITVSIFESLFDALRTYVFSHTTNRIDVELSARLSSRASVSTGMPVGQMPVASATAAQIAGVTAPIPILPAT